MDKLGALWLSSSQNPKAPYAKGSLEVNGVKIPIVVWYNQKKVHGDKYPDYYINKDAPKGEKGEKVSF